MNNKYRLSLGESKKLNGSGLLQKASAYNITADKILYDHAIQMVSKFIAIRVFRTYDVVLFNIIIKFIY